MTKIVIRKFARKNLFFFTEIHDRPRFQTRLTPLIHFPLRYPSPILSTPSPNLRIPTPPPSISYSPIHSSSTTVPQPSYVIFFPFHPTSHCASPSPPLKIHFHSFIHYLSLSDWLN